jgi:hypothetical protein
MCDSFDPFRVGQSFVCQPGTLSPAIEFVPFGNEIVTPKGSVLTEKGNITPKAWHLIAGGKAPGNRARQQYDPERVEQHLRMSHFALDFHSTGLLK